MFLIIQVKFTIHLCNHAVCGICLSRSTKTFENGQHVCVCPLCKKLEYTSWFEVDSLIKAFGSIVSPFCSNLKTIQSRNSFSTSHFINKCRERACTCNIHQRFSSSFLSYLRSEYKLEILLIENVSQSYIESVYPS
jgi:hypothetical protein